MRLWSSIGLCGSQASLATGTCRLGLTEQNVSFNKEGKQINEMKLVNQFCLSNKLFCKYFQIACYFFYFDYNLDFLCASGALWEIFFVSYAMIVQCSI